MRRSSLLPLVSGLLAAGCGGGGGSHPSGSGTTGLTFAGNSIVYGAANGTGADFSVFEFVPGAAPTTVVADVSGSILAFALDPHTAGRYALAADPTGAGTYGIVLAKGLTLTNATTLVAPTYTSVSSLTVTPDGARVVYTATTPAGASELFSVSTSGGTPVDLGPADGATVSPLDGDTVAYVAPVGSVGDDQVFTRSLAAGASGAARQITTDATNHALPAFSRDGTRLAFWTLSGGGNALLVDTLATGATVSVPGVSGVEPQGVAFGPDGSTLAFVGGVGVLNEILTTPADGSAAPTVVLSASPLLGDHGFFWTDGSGRVLGGTRAGVSSRTRRR